MKPIAKIIFRALLLGGLQLLLSSCGTGGGYASAQYVDTGGVYYGPAYGDVWIHDDHWVDGHHWDHHPDPHAEHHDDGYIHPPRYQSPPPNQHHSESHGAPPTAPPHGQPPHESNGRDGR